MAALPGREKFLEPTNCLTLPAVTAWVVGLNKITIWKELAQSKQATGKYELYIFPDPQWFLNVQEARCACLLKNWLKSRGTWMRHASQNGQNIPALSITLWKEAIHLSFGIGGKINLASKKGQHVKKMVEFFGCSVSTNGQLQLSSGS